MINTLVNSKINGNNLIPNCAENLRNSENQENNNKFEEYPKEIRLTKNEDIKILAYKKLGMVNYIDKMLSDKSAKIREIAVSYMDFGDIRIKSLTKEKTKKVLYSAILKAPADILPFFIGNDVIKKDYGLTDLFRRRMEESTG